MIVSSHISSWYHSHDEIPLSNPSNPFSRVEAPDISDCILTVGSTIIDQIISPVSCLILSMNDVDSNSPYHST